MKRVLLLIAFFYACFLHANPTVTVAPMPGVQDNPTSNSVIYFAVTFSESMAGFTESDIVVTGTAQANNVFIKLYSCLIPDQNFIIGVTGMWTSGSVSVTIPAEVAASNNEGIGNLASNTVEVMYEPPFEECAILAGNVANEMATFYYPGIGYNPTGSCTSFAYCSPVLNGGVFGSYKAFRYVNTTGSTLCLNVKVFQLGETCYPFHIYKDNLPVVDDFSYVERWIGGSAGSVYEDVSPSTRNGYTYRFAHAQVAPGQTFYVVVKTTSEDFYVSTNLNCSALNYLGDATFLVHNPISIQPNPSDGIFNISSEVALDAISVYNSLGQKILETNNAQFDLSQHSKGIYFVQMESEGKKSTHKIILH